MKTAGSEILWYNKSKTHTVQQMSSFQHLIDKTRGTECQQPTQLHRGTRAVTSRLIDDLTLTVLQHVMQVILNIQVQLTIYNALP